MGSPTIASYSGPLALSGGVSCTGPAQLTGTVSMLQPLPPSTQLQMPAAGTTGGPYSFGTDGLFVGSIGGGCDVWGSLTVACTPSGADQYEGTVTGGNTGMSATVQGTLVLPIPAGSPFTVTYGPKGAPACSGCFFPFGATTGSDAGALAVCGGVDFAVATALTGTVSMLQPPVTLQIVGDVPAGGQYSVTTDGLFVGFVGGTGEGWGVLGVFCTPPAPATEYGGEVSGGGTLAQGDPVQGCLVLPIPAGSTLYYSYNYTIGQNPPGCTGYFFPFGNGTATPA